MKTCPPRPVLALAYPERIAKNLRRGGGGIFSWPTAVAATLIQSRPLARETVLAVAELVGSAAQSRITLATAIDLADIEGRFADRIEAARGGHLRRQDINAAGEEIAPSRWRSYLNEQPLAVTPNDATAKLIVSAILQRGSTACRETKAVRQWRDRVQFLRRTEGRRMAGRVRRSARRDGRGLARTAVGRQDLA